MDSRFFILLINPLIAFLFALAFLATWAKIRSKSYTLVVSAGFLSATITYLLQSFAPLPAAHNALFVHIFLFATVSMFVSAALVRNGLPIPYLAYGSIAAVFLGAVAWFLYVAPSFQVRVHLTDATLALVVAVALREQLKVRRSVADNILIFLGGLAIAYYVSRSVALRLVETPGNPFGWIELETYWTLVQLSAVLFSILLAVSYVLSVAYELMDELRLEARSDHLSGLLNRRGFMQQATTVLMSANQEGMIAMIADLDHFKAINDTYGHEIGDAAIAQFGRLLREEGASDFIAGRLGGEEFAVLVPRPAMIEARAYIDRVRAGLEKIAGLPPGCRITASFGIYAANRGETLSGMLRAADDALYAAKSAGRDRSSLTLSPLVAC